MLEYLLTLDGIRWCEQVSVEREGMRFLLLASLGTLYRQDNSPYWYCNYTITEDVEDVACYDNLVLAKAGMSIYGYDPRTRSLTLCKPVVM